MDKPGGILARVGTPAGASVAVDIAGVKTVVDVIDGFHDVPGADVATNAQMRDALGNKADVGADVVAATTSLMAYIKGQTQERAQRNVAKFALGSVASATPADVINISDKGVFTGLNQNFAVSAADNGGYFVITIDGTSIGSIIVGASMSNTNSMAVGISLAFTHRFDTSLRVQHYTDGGAGTLKTMASYTIDA